VSISDNLSIGKNEVFSSKNDVLSSMPISSETTGNDSIKNSLSSRHSTERRSTPSKKKMSSSSSATSHESLQASFVLSMTRGSRNFLVKKNSYKKRMKKLKNEVENKKKLSVSSSEKSEISLIRWHNAVIQNHERELYELSENESSRSIVLTVKIWIE
jgi:hypothetical protein